MTSTLCVAPSTMPSGGRRQQCHGPATPTLVMPHATVAKRWARAIYSSTSKYGVVGSRRRVLADARPTGCALTHTLARTPQPFQNAFQYGVTTTFSYPLRVYQSSTSCRL